MTQAPAYVYLLELPLDAKPDGIFHPLKVKVSRNDVDVQARHGYTFAKPQKNKK